MDKYEVITLATGVSNFVEACNKAEAAIHALNNGYISEDAYAGFIYHHSVANKSVPTWYDGYYIRNMGKA